MVVILLPIMKINPSAFFGICLHLPGYPTITFPILIVYVFFLNKWTNKFLSDNQVRFGEALEFGLIITLVNIFLDTLIYFFMFNISTLFNSSIIWLSYAVMILVPIWNAKYLKLSNYLDREE